MSTNLNPELCALLEHFALDRTFVRGEGAWLEDERGRRVLDLSAQYGALPFGHSPDVIWDALLAARAAKVPSLVQPSRPLLAEKLAARLAAIAPIGEEAADAVVTFTQSGSEAVEAAIQLARRATGRPLIVAMERGYHGKTLGAAALTWRSARECPPELRPPGFAHVAWDDAPALESFLLTHAGQVAAVIVEPIQGEGGVLEPSADFLPRVRELCSAHGAKLILDEVQTGLGRTGTIFAAEHWGVRADIVCLSKALGGGLVPLAATIAARDAWSESFALTHGSTFANNNVTCAAGLATLDALEREDGALLAHVQALGAALREGFESLRQRFPGVIRAVRGRGLMLGLELERVPETAFFVQHAFEQDAFLALVASHLLNEHAVRVIPCLTHGRALRIQPPLTLTPEEARLALDAFEALVVMIHRRDWAALVAPLLARGETGRRADDLRALERPVRGSRAIEVGEDPTRFAFLIHCTSPDDLVATTPAFARLSAAERRALYEWTAAQPAHSPVCFMPSIRGADGAVAQGWLVGVTHTPESMRARPRAEVSAEIARAVSFAQEELGAHVVGLGAFTSIVTQNGAAVPGERSAITTGSALTVAAAVDGIELACARLGRSPRRGLVVGLGVVGSAAAVVASDFLPRLVLSGNPGRPERETAKARALMDRIYARAARRLDDDGARGVTAVLRARLGRFAALGERGRRLVARLDAIAGGEDDASGIEAEVAWASFACSERPPLQAAPLREALRGADVVIAATSAATPLLGPTDLAPGAIVCDVAKPADVAASVHEQRPDVLVFDGGLVRYPEPIAFGPNMGYEPGVNLACLTETVVLALEGVRRGRFGVGLATDLVDAVPRIREAARKHGFAVGELRAQGRVLGPNDFERVRAGVAPATRGAAA